MSALIADFGSIGIRPTSQNKNQNQNQTKEGEQKTQYWVNVGLVRQNSEGENVMISLPMGIPLDNLKPQKIPSQSTKNPEFRHLRIAQAQLWEKVTQLMSQLKPGESHILPFQVEIRRVEEKEALTEDEVAENPFALGDLKL